MLYYTCMCPKTIELFCVLKTSMNSVISSIPLQRDPFLLNNGCLPFNCCGIPLYEYSRIYLCNLPIMKITQFCVISMLQ